MGNGNIYPMHPYPDENYVVTQGPHCHHHGTHTVYNSVIPSYPYGYGRGYARPFVPVPSFQPTMMYPAQIGVRGYFTTPYATNTGVLPSAPPPQQQSQVPHGNIHGHAHRPGEYRAHFDQQ